MRYPPLPPRPRHDQGSLIDLFTIGIGPSSSHTVGPMRAAYRFMDLLTVEACDAVSISCDLYGSLALTGRGHATDKAVLLGLAGYTPEAIDPAEVDAILGEVRRSGLVPFGAGRTLAFDAVRDIRWNAKPLSAHPNALRLTAHLRDGRSFVRTFYSVGGGAIRLEGENSPEGYRGIVHPCGTAAELLASADGAGLTIAQIVRANEAGWRDPAQTEVFVDSVLAAMSACIDRGCGQDGELPGALHVRRRARSIHASLSARDPRTDPGVVFEWVSLWALAVNEENAAGGRVVTAPTNGAAGVLPAVIRYYETFVHGATIEGKRDFLYTASAIGFLYKRNASISAAEMGCQGEVGVACSMAAAGLCAVLGGNNGQVENAAEIGMEHNLGLTCDPIGGLVQIPCIERNTMGAIKAINAAYLALHGDGEHIVSLDQVIETMRQTGEDMKSQYKETSLGGLAVNVVEC